MITRKRPPWGPRADKGVVAVVALLVAVLLVGLTESGAKPLAPDWMLLNAGAIVRPYQGRKVVSLTPDRVHLTPGSFVKAAEDLNTKYLLMFEEKRMLYSFEKTAGFTPRSIKSYGGWEGPRTELRGHFVGHFLMAAATRYQATGDEKLKKLMDAVVEGIYACQKKIGTGYVSAFPVELIDRVEHLQKVWAPYYTIHKILAGLLDQYRYAGNDLALQIASNMTDYFYKRTGAFIEEAGEDYWKRVLFIEFGGIGEVLYELYRVKRDPSLLVLAKRFDKHSFLDPLANHQDRLKNLHANTHLAQILHSIQVCELEGDPVRCDVVEYFWKLLVTTRTYSTGGSNHGEHWQTPNQLGKTLRNDNQEFCTSYNYHRVLRALFSWDPSPSIAAYIERIFWNGILGHQKLGEPGVMMYYLPLRPGAKKSEQRKDGWGTPWNTFWCCYGTGIEQYSKLSESVFWYNDPSFNRTISLPEVYVVLYLAAIGRFPNGLVLRQETKFPEEESFKIHVDHVPANNTRTIMHLFQPSWARNYTVTLNGQSVMPRATRIMTRSMTYFDVVRTFRVGDIISVTFKPMWHVEQIKDDRRKYKSLHSLLYGPLVMAAIADGNVELGGKSFNDMESWISPIAGTPLRFEVKDFQGKKYTLFPLFQAQEERYTVYMNIYDVSGDSALPSFSTSSSAAAYGSRPKVGGEVEAESGAKTSLSSTSSASTSADGDENPSSSSILSSSSSAMNGAAAIEQAAEVEDEEVEKEEEGMIAEEHATRISGDFGSGPVEVLYAGNRIYYSMLIPSLTIVCIISLATALHFGMYIKSVRHIVRSVSTSARSSPTRSLLASH